MNLLLQFSSAQVSGSPALDSAVFLTSKETICEGLLRQVKEVEGSFKTVPHPRSHPPRSKEKNKGNLENMGYL